MFEKLKSILYNPNFYISKHFEALKFVVDKAFLDYSTRCQNAFYSNLLKNIEKFEKETNNLLDIDKLYLFKAEIERLEECLENQEQETPEIIKKIKRLEYDMNAVLFGNKTTFIIKKFKTMPNILVQLEDFYFENITEIDNLESTGFLSRIEIFKSLLKENLLKPECNGKCVFLNIDATLDNEDLFYGLINISIISMFANPLILSSTIFNGLINLKELTLDGNNLVQLDACLFYGLTNLERLIINNNELTDLHEEIFKGLKNLKFIDFNSNKINKLPASIFKNLENLRCINFGRNQIRELNENIFNGLVNLHSLYFAGNMIQNLNPNIFNGLSSLCDLDFSHNYISCLDEFVFKDLKKLRTLRFAYNLLENLEPDIIVGSPELTLINFSGNRISELDHKLFRNLSSKVKFKSRGNITSTGS